MMYELYTCHANLWQTLHANFDFHNHMEQDITKYRNLGRIYITGDLNSRVADTEDFLRSDSHKC